MFLVIYFAALVQLFCLFTPLSPLFDACQNIAHLYTYMVRLAEGYMSPSDIVIEIYPFVPKFYFQCQKWLILLVSASSECIDTILIQFLVRNLQECSNGRKMGR